MARRLPPSLSTLPLPVCPWRAFYPSPVRISMARRLPVIFHSGWATAKLGIDLGGVFSKAPELGRKQEHCSATSTLSPSHAISLRRQIAVQDVELLEGVGGKQHNEICSLGHVGRLQSLQRI